MKKIISQDLTITFCIVLLSITSLIAVYSTTFYYPPDIQSNFGKQFIYLIAGFAMYLMITAINSQWLRQAKVQFLIYLANFGLLIYLLFFGEVIAETRRWIDFGIISIQPAEFAKIVVILLTALIFGSRAPIQLTKPEKVNEHHHGSIPLHILIPVRDILFSMLAIIPIVYCIYKQPSLGNALITIVLWLLMLIALIKQTKHIFIYMLCIILGLTFTTSLISWPAGIDLPLRILILAIVTIGFLAVNYLILYKSKTQLAIITSIIVIGAIAGLLLSATWNYFLDDYQKDRITAFVNPDADPQGTGWQVQRAKIAISSAPIPFGFGFLQGPQTSSKYLPYPYTDFIFAAFTEQFGLFGASIILLIYFVLIYRIMNLVAEIPDNFGKLVIFGVGIMITLNLIINVGMNIGIMPVTGVPLPLISYGGSSVLVNMLALGLVQMIYTEQDLSTSNAVKLY